MSVWASRVNHEHGLSSSKEIPKPAIKLNFSKKEAFVENAKVWLAEQLWMFSARKDSAQIALILRTHFFGGLECARVSCKVEVVNSH
jgi:hypothetical protein